MKLPILLAALAASASPAFAQGLHESINVEGNYKAEVIRRERINVLPEKMNLELESEPLEYSRVGVTAETAPGFLALPALGLGDTRTPSRNRGYLTLGLGSYLNSDLSAGYRIVDNGRSTLGAALQANSSSLFKPFAPLTDARRWFGDGTLSLYGSHAFGNAGRLSAAVDYRLAAFNYLTPASDPSQSLNNVRADLLWSAPAQQGATKASYYIGAGYELFSYRRLYMPFGGQMYKGGRENRLSLSGGFNLRTGSGSNIGLDAALTGMLYNTDASPFQPGDYGLFHFNPYYRFNRGLLNIRIGVNLDFAAGAGPAEDRFSPFHISPDVRLDYRHRGVGVYLHVLGGARLQTLASLQREDYYQLPVIANTRPEFSPLDARVGAVFGPFSGFSAQLSFAYRIANNLRLGGLYLANLADPVQGAAYEECTRNAEISLKGFSVGAELNYSLNNALDVKAAASYQPQHGERGYWSGIDRPRWLVHTRIDVRPIDRLGINLGFSYRGVRSLCYTMPVSVGDYPTVAYEYRTVGLRDVTDLHAGASFRFGSALPVTVWANVHNLLGCKTDLLYQVPGLAYPAANFMAGVGITF